VGREREGLKGWCRINGWRRRSVDWGGPEEVLKSGVGKKGTEAKKENLLASKGDSRLIFPTIDKCNWGRGQPEKRKKDYQRSVELFIEVGNKRET